MMRDYATISKRLRQYSENCVAYKLDADFANAVTDAADAIEELLAKVPTWISVEDELPEEWRAVLAYMPIHSDEKNPHMIRICWYIGYGKWRETEYGEIVEIPVTHWMHLPAPPKGVE